MPQSSRILITALALLLVTGPSVAGGMKIKIDTDNLDDFAKESQYDWSGFYTGAAVVHTFQFRATGQVSDEGYDTLQPRGSGTKGGGYAGYNIQVNSFILGGELDISYGWNKNSRAATGTYYYLDPTTNLLASTSVPLNLRLHQNASYSFRGRLGYAFDNILIFTSLGFASTHLDFNGRVLGSATATDANGNTVKISKLYSGYARNLANGYVLGFGLEYGITKNWLARAEYMYTNTNIKSPTYFYNYRFGLQEHEIRSGIAYKF